MGFNPYNALAVPRSATPAEVRKAYKKASIMHHPDKAMQKGVSKEVAEAKMKELNRAKEILCDDVARYVYNQYGLKEAEQSSVVEGVRAIFADVSEEEMAHMFSTGIW